LILNVHLSGQAKRLTQAIEDNEPIGIPGVVLTEILLSLQNDSEASRIAQLLEDWPIGPKHALNMSFFGQKIRMQAYFLRINCY